MPYLSFIEDRDLILAVKKVIQKIELAKQHIDLKLYKNVLDPFSALFDGITHDISYDEWLASEKVRQIQKTMQNAIGEFHQDVLGSTAGCKNLGSGGGLDICHQEKGIIAEIKNKFNTTKGNHKVAIYDSIKSKLKTEEYRDFIGYYVEIIPAGRKIYNKPFTPPDNKTKKRRPSNEAIRVIDGRSFYEMVTGEERSLQDLFEALPLVVADNFSYRFDKKQVREYGALFARAFIVK